MEVKKLSDKEIAELLRRVEKNPETVTSRELADEFKTNRTYVSLLLRMNGWKYVCRWEKIK